MRCSSGTCTPARKSPASPAIRGLSAASPFRLGRRALSGGDDKTVRVWDLTERRLLATLEGHHGPVRSVLFAWDGRHAFSTGDDGRLVLWETNERRLQDEFKGDDYAMAALAVEKLGGFAAVGCSDKLIRVWDLEHWKPAWTYTGDQDTVT